MSAKVNARNNLNIRQDGTKLVIELELVDVELEESGSGKSDIVATTGGNRQVLLKDGTYITVGLNAYIPKRSRR